MSGIAIPFYSQSGHTRRLAQIIKEGITNANLEVDLIDISDMSNADWNLLIEADGIIFGSPTYMGSAPGRYKMFLDESATRGFWTKQKLADKMAAGFTVATYPSGDKLSTLMQLAVYAAQNGMIWIGCNDIGSKVSGDEEGRNQCGSWLGLMATSISDKNIFISDEDALTAKQFGLRFATCVSRWMKQSF